MLNGEADRREWYVRSVRTQPLNIYNGRPTIMEMSRLLGWLVESGSSWDFIYLLNLWKSKMLAVALTLNDLAIPVVEKVKYLGIFMNIK